VKENQYFNDFNHVYYCNVDKITETTNLKNTRFLIIWFWRWSIQDKSNCWNSFLLLE